MKSITQRLFPQRIYEAGWARTVTQSCAGRPWGGGPTGVLRGGRSVNGTIGSAGQGWLVRCRRGARMRNGVLLVVLVLGGVAATAPAKTKKEEVIPKLFCNAQYVSVQTYEGDPGPYLAREYPSDYDAAVGVQNRIEKWGRYRVLYESDQAGGGSGFRGVEGAQDREPASGPADGDAACRRSTRAEVREPEGRGRIRGNRASRRGGRDRAPAWMMGRATWESPMAAERAWVESFPWTISWRCIRRLATRTRARRSGSTP